MGYFTVYHSKSLHNWYRRTPNRGVKHAFVTAGFLYTFTFVICFLNNTTLTGVFSKISQSNKLCLCSSSIHNHVAVIIVSTSNVSSILVQVKYRY